MSYPHTAIDKITVELADMAKAYAKKAADLASDPYFNEAIVKSSVSGFVWALYHAFDTPLERDALSREMKVQSEALDRAITSKAERNNA